MKNALFSLLFLSSMLFSEEKPLTVRVLIKKVAVNTRIEVKGRHHLYNPKTEMLLKTSTKKRKGIIHDSDHGLVWDEQLKNIHEVRIVPDEKNCSILVDGIQYNGWTEIFGIGGTITIINEIDVDNYLKSLLSAQLRGNWSNETLDALVITQRTALINLIEKREYASWQLEARKEGYRGLTFDKSIHDAVERTRGLILHFNKKPFAATWGENLAGRSVSYRSIFRKAVPSPDGVDHLPSLDNKNKSKWKYSLALANLADQLGIPPIQGIDLFRAEHTSKIYAIRFITERKKFDIGIADFQRRIGSNNLLSNDFQAIIKGKKVYFLGYGKGLGSGLCLASAEILAKRKASLERILSTHFPHTQLVNMRYEGKSSSPTTQAWN